MDILKIRKKKAAEAAGDVDEADEREEVAEAASGRASKKKAARKTKKKSKKASKRKPASAVEPDVAPAPAEPPADSAPLRAALSGSLEVEDVDPLQEFLARYDDGAEDDDGEDEDETAGTREETKRFLAFELAGEAYAASIMDVREILRVVALTEVPRAPIQILGVLSKRGVVMPVVDLAATLGLREPEPRYQASQRVLVVGEGDRRCGLRVDRVQEVVRLREQDIEEVPASLGTRAAHQLRGLGRVGERMFILLDVSAVLHGLAVTAGIETREEL
jgi:purine-binding chemotaxis protein CheW